MVHTARLQTVCASVAATICAVGWGPQVQKFIQAFSVGYQMSVAGRELGLRSDVWGSGGSRSHVWWGTGTLRFDVTYVPPVNRRTPVKRLPSSLNLIQNKVQNSVPHTDITMVVEKKRVLSNPCIPPGLWEN